MAERRRIRCAIYTRKSSEEGLEQQFNSLDAQREACEAYVASQRREGWELIATRYDDGGISGGHLERPALRRLMQDVDDRRVDQIVVYKIDRLTRSLPDFAKLVDRLDQADASFVSVTQFFNTATSMGRLTLNVLLSFAQFEREVTAERIRDKIAASKRKGLWMGGGVPLGYQAAGRTLKIDPAEAGLIQKIYAIYEAHGALNVVVTEAAKMGLRSRKRQAKNGGWRGGKIMARGHIHYILANPIYAGRIPHKGKIYEGQHPAIIDPERWDAVQEQLERGSAIPRGPITRKTKVSPLAGKLLDEHGGRLSPSHANKHGKLYRYDVSCNLLTGRKADAKGRGWRLPAGEVEALVARAIQQHLKRHIGGWLSAFGDPEIQCSAHEELNDTSRMLPTVSCVRLGDGVLSIDLDADKIGDALDVETANIGEQILSFSTPFSIRRRGVETKFVMVDQIAQRDQKLFMNVAKAHVWLEQIKKGASFDEIANSEKTTKKRVQQMMNFAFLAPDITRDILAGKQPIGLTSTWCMTHDLPLCWKEQRALIASL